MANPLRHRRLLAGAVLLLVILLGATAYAAHSFTDVPDGHIFHDDVAWMKDSGITKGCNPPDNTRYCLDDALTRGEMAAFLHRLALSQEVGAGTLDGLDSTDFAWAGASVGDADTLDGKDSSDFLAVGAKATDADKLDGNDSSAFVQVGDLAGALKDSIYLATATEGWLLAINNEVIASCDPGDLLIGGGYESAGLVEINVEDDYPDGNDWVVRGMATLAVDVTAYAICVDAA